MSLCVVPSVLITPKWLERANIYWPPTVDCVITCEKCRRNIKTIQSLTTRSLPQKSYHLRDYLTQRLFYKIRELKREKWYLWPVRTKTKTHCLLLRSDSHTWHGNKAQNMGTKQGFTQLALVVQTWKTMLQDHGWTWNKFQRTMKIEVKENFLGEMGQNGEKSGSQKQEYFLFIQQIFHKHLLGSCSMAGLHHAWDYIAVNTIF